MRAIISITFLLVLIGPAPGQLRGEVNVNTADASQLQTLKGVSPSAAGDIVFERDTRGIFTSFADLAARVPGVNKEMISGWGDAAVCRPASAFPARAGVEIEPAFPASSQVDVPSDFPASADVPVKAGFPAQADVGVKPDFPANADVPVQDALPADAEVEIKDDFPQEAGVAIKDPFAEE